MGLHATRHYTKEHEWLEVDDGVAIVGITDYAQSQLGDVVFVELPSAGTELKQGREAAVVESVKAASDVYSPIDGIVAEVNTALESDPSLVNSSPEGEGWFFKLNISDAGQIADMMDEAAYKAYVAGL